MKKRRSFIVKILDGSMTVEAALLLPFMIFALTGMLFLIQVMNIQQKVQYALMKTAWEASEYAVVYRDFQENETEEQTAVGKATKTTEGKMEKSDEATGEGKDEATQTQELVSKLLSGSFFAATMSKYLDRDELENSCVLGGIWGIQYIDSSFFERSEEIEVVAGYQIKIPLPLVSFTSFPIRQRAVSRGFVGSKSWDRAEEQEGEGQEEDPSQNNSERVYVTKTGTKYHCRRDCTYLQLTIKDVLFQEVGQLRNASGAIYYPCESCVGQEHVPEKVFLTEYGTRYHALLSCSKLKRTIYETDKEEAVKEGKTPCSKCAK